MGAEKPQGHEEPESAKTEPQRHEEREPTGGNGGNRGVGERFRASISAFICGWFPFAYFVSFAVKSFLSLWTRVITRQSESSLARYQPAGSALSAGFCTQERRAGFLE